MSGRLVTVLLLALLVVAIVLAVVIRPARLVNHERLSTLKHALARELNDRPVQSRLVFLVGYVLLGVLGLPVVTLLVPAGGYLFGWWCGTLLGVAGSVLAAMLSYVLARLWLGRRLRRRYSVRQRWFRRELQRHGASYLLTSRLLLVVPFVWVNTLAGLARVSVIRFFWTLLVGMVPVCMLYAWAGAQLQRVHCLADTLSPPMLGAFVLVAALVVLRLVWVKRQRLLRRIQGRTADTR